MANFKCAVQLGQHSVEISTENFEELYESVAQVSELHQRIEGEQVDLVVRKIDSGKKKFKKFGVRRIKDGATLDFGQNTEKDVPVSIFGYHQNHPDYKGFKKYGEEEVKQTANAVADKFDADIIHHDIANLTFLTQAEKSKVNKWISNMKQESRSVALDSFKCEAKFDYWNKSVLDAVIKHLGRDFTK